MTHYGSKELAQSFRTVRKNTLEAARDIPEDKYDFSATPDCRSVEKLLTHIALAYRFQHRVNAVEKLSSMAGVDFPAMMAELGANEEPGDRDARGRGRDLGDLSRWRLRRVPGRARLIPTGVFAAAQEPVRVDSRGERARDASPRPGYAGPADAGYCPTPHSAAGSAHGPDSRSRGRHVKGANIAAFIKVADAMLAYRVV